MWQEKIEIEGPYNFDIVLERQSLDPLSNIDKKNRSIKVPVFLEQDPNVIDVMAVGTIEDPVFILTGGQQNVKDALIDRVSEIFQWNVPLKQIHEHFQKTSLNELFKEHIGTPLVLDFDLFGCLIKCVIHQQLNLRFAYTLTERFVKTFGFEKDGAWFYPSPQTVAVLTVDQLRELQFSGRKAEYVIGIAKAVVEGELDIESFKQDNNEEVFTKLIKLRGVGNWTIQNLLLFGLGRQNLFPTADIGIQNALKKLYKLEQKPTLEEMEQYKQGWEPYLSYASLYLWRSIE
ncbi:DNA-3-methyladenine glycosylase [Bacillus sp. EB600]|uniref:DNA-3-methyladenine glycosylase family protein n=1 Tax=Bacillus sp. EB600 TaxID=2806345 RepID=UPI002109939E|nr:DNA-3-methyladenine glycosylase [Bacillus sp. EB600]